ncbi:hypothetical protein HK405_003138 [Cladochytrium tenue]|nr:hypothetical protein HK405_003138 [Cladochytrium tenue]
MLISSLTSSMTPSSAAAAAGALLSASTAVTATEPPKSANAPSKSTLSNPSAPPVQPPPQQRGWHIGYWIRTSATGHGYVTEAVVALAGVALAPESAGGLELPAIDIWTNPDNVRSAAVASRAGFRLVGKRWFNPDDDAIDFRFSLDRDHRPPLPPTVVYHPAENVDL